MSYETCEAWERLNLGSANEAAVISPCCDCTINYVDLTFFRNTQLHHFMFDGISKSSQLVAGCFAVCQSPCTNVTLSGQRIANRGTNSGERCMQTPSSFDFTSLGSLFRAKSTFVDAGDIILTPPQFAVSRVKSA